MSDLKINRENKLVIVDGDLVITPTTVDTIAQNVRQRLRILKGEWFLDRTKGLPYFEVILEKNPRSEVVITLFKNTILDTKGVTKLNYFDLSFNNSERKLNLEFQATVTTGEVIYFEEQL